MDTTRRWGRARSAARHPAWSDRRSRMYPHTSENGAGERLTSLRRVPTPGGDSREVENVITTGSGPPMHNHQHQEEALKVARGRICKQRLGELARFAGPGETVVFKPGEPHRFWNAGDAEVRVTGYIEPADNAEYFLTELYEIGRAHV